ncbi:MAG: hypothetical protein AAGG38_07675 [Planctomycetota bacterium]
MVRSEHSGSKSHRSATPRGRKATDRTTSRRSKLVLQLGSLAVVGIAAGLAAMTPLLTSQPRPLANTNHDVVAAPPLASIGSAALTVKYDRPTYDLEPQTHADLMAIPASELHRIDIARVNLLCASGMPTTEGLDVKTVTGYA